MNLILSGRMQSVINQPRGYTRSVMLVQYHGKADVAKLLNEVDHSGGNDQGRDTC